MTVFSIIHNAMGNVSDKIVKISRVGLAWLAFLTLSPLLLLIFGSLLLWKYVILWVIVKLFKRKFLQGFANAEAVFAIDRFWENSRSSLGLIVEIDGNVNIDNFRDEFKKKVLDYVPTKYPIPHMEESSSSSLPSSCNKPFAKLTQIPVTFCGYYFWQKANYFLIHEHIRQINQPTDEIGLKKAVGTLMTLPYPNRRPLWEILVYSNYLGTTTVGRGTTCGSALFIRIHRSLADSQGLMNLLRHMISSTGTVAPIIDSVKSIQHLQTSSMKSENSVTATTTSINTVQIATSAFSRHISKKCTSLVFFPLRAFQFAQKIINVPDGIAKSNVESEGQGEEGPGQGHSHLDSANASWTLLQDALVHKISLNQSPLLIGRSAVEMSLFLEGLTARSRHKCLNVPEEKGQAESHPHQGKCKTRVLVPVMTQGETSPYYRDELILTNDRSFVTIESPCVSSSEILPSSNSNKTAILKSIQTQLHHHYQPQFGENDDRDHNQIVRLYLALLSLLPRHLLRYLLLANKWGAGCFIFEQFQIHLDKPAGDKPEELKLFGQYPVSQIVPLVGLQWTHTLASAATLRWRDGEIVMSLIANASILGPLSQGNPQDHVERIVRGFPEDVEKLAEDAEDHGFVSIPIS